MFNALVVIFFLSFLMLLFSIITIVAKIINKRSVKKSLIMINIFFITTNIAFIFGTIIFVSQNEIDLFKETHINEKAVEVEVEVASSNITSTITQENSSETNSKLAKSEPDFNNLNWRLILDTATNDVESKFRSTHVESMSNTPFNNDVTIKISVPEYLTADDIVSMIDYALKSINDNVRSQMETIKASKTEYYGGVFDYLNTNIIITHEYNKDFKIVEHFIEKGTHMQTPITICVLPNNNNNFYNTSRYSNRVRLVSPDFEYYDIPIKEIFTNNEQQRQLEIQRQIEEQEQQKQLDIQRQIEEQQEQQRQIETQRQIEEQQRQLEIQRQLEEQQRQLEIQRQIEEQQRQLEIQRQLEEPSQFNTTLNSEAENNFNFDEVNIN